MRIPFIAANWKMHKTVHESVVFVKEFRSLVKDIEDVEIVVAPPFTAVHAVAEAARNSNVGVAAQNLHWERQGAFTGEVSAEMVREAGSRVRDHRALGAPAPVRRYRRARQPPAHRGARRQADADRLHRRDARGARGQPDARRARPPDQGGTRQHDRRADRLAGHRLRAGLGDRDRAGTPRPSRPARRMPTSGSASASGSAATRRTTATSSTAAASKPTIPAISWRCPTSTGRSSAGRASISRDSSTS